MSSGTTSQDNPWEQKGRGEEARYIHQKEQEQLAALKEKLDKEKESVPDNNKDFEGGFGGQEDLEDRYATTSGDH